MNRRQLLIASGAVAATLSASKESASADTELVEAAKAVIRDHENKAHGGDLDEIVTNIASDIVLFAPGAELVQGIPSFRDFYQTFLDMGTWEFRHEYSGHDVEGESVITYGVAHGTLTAPENELVEFANNFMLVLKPENGRFKIWRGAFAPNA